MEDRKRKTMTSRENSIGMLWKIGKAKVEVIDQTGNCMKNKLKKKKSGLKEKNEKERDRQ